MHDIISINDIISFNIVNYYNDAKRGAETWGFHESLS